MSYLNLKKKRATLLCAFLILSCTPNESLDTKRTTSVEDSQTSSEHDIIDDQNSQQALLTLNELLSASDVEQGLALAVKQNDTEMLKYWQQQLLSAAKEVNLLEREVAILRGDSGLQYLEFQGMKTNYQSEFEKAFFNFEDAEKVFKRYPAFEDMQKASRALLHKRDVLVDELANEIEQQGFDGNARSEAKRRWQAFMLEQSKLAPNN